jgi:hypothetical protein
MWSKRVDLGRQLGQTAGQRLFVEVAEQGLVEAFVLALGGRLVGLAGDRLDPETRDVLHELAEESAPGRVERRTIVGQRTIAARLSRWLRPPTVTA